MFTLPKDVDFIIDTLQKKGFLAFAVGGSIRDALLTIEAKDWDIATNAKPSEVTELFERVIPTGIDFGTVSVLLNSVTYEVTTFRKDGRYLDGRRPEEITFAATIEEDLSRRDFTINAMAYDSRSGKLIDPFNGQADLKDKQIRAVGDAVERFSEDGLRALRACRFAAQLGFDIEKITFEAIAKTIGVFKKVSPERIHDELVKLLSSDEPIRGLEYMRKSGLMSETLPELMTGIGIEQPKPFHVYDVYNHNIHTCEYAPKDFPLVRLAGLFHDISKPECKKEETFYDHDNQGALLAENIMKRLKFSNIDIAKVSVLVKSHMFNYTDEWTDAAIRRFIRRVGRENIDELFLLRVADMKAMNRGDETGYLRELKDRIAKIYSQDDALSVSDLKINGNEIMELLNIEPGQRVGQILNLLLEQVLDEPAKNSKDFLREAAKQIMVSEKAID